MPQYKPHQQKGQDFNCQAWEGLRFHASSYGAILCDIWGVVHNGVRATASAVEALERYRAEQGGKVLLISNAPRPAASVREQLARMGITSSAYDGILTSGDLTQSVLVEETLGHYCYHLGPKRDLGLFEGAATERVGLSEAQFILCTGLEDDDSETAEDYRALLEIGQGRALKLVCANPDIVVERDGKLLPCAGAVAAFYQELGGEVIYFGKPHHPIYERAREMFASLAPAPAVAGGAATAEKGMLVVGDGLLTDIKGAVAEGLDSLFILGGIAADIGKDEESVNQFCSAQGIHPKAFMPRLQW